MRPSFAPPPLTISIAANSLTLLATRRRLKQKLAKKNKKRGNFCHSTFSCQNHYRLLQREKSSFHFHSKFSFEQFCLSSRCGSDCFGKLHHPPIDCWQVQCIAHICILCGFYSVVNSVNTRKLNSLHMIFSAHTTQIYILWIVLGLVVILLLKNHPVYVYCSGWWSRCGSCTLQSAVG